MNALVYSSSLAAAFLGGVLALFAPCCIVSLLPTFVGAAVERGRLRLPLTTAVYAGGVAAVLLPILLGVGALGQLLRTYHRPVFLLVGAFLAFLGLNVLFGHRWSLPMPTLRVRAGGTNSGGIFLLGVVSGLASSCCAPVVAGVIAMSALAASVAGALGLGIAYVFGMVFPLFLVALFWNQLPLGERPRFRLGASPLRLQGRPVSWPDLVAALMFLAIAALTLGLAFTGQSSFTPDWLVGWNRWATGLAGSLAAALRTVPAYLQALFLALLAAGIAAGIYRARRAEAKRDLDGI